MPARAPRSRIGADACPGVFAPHDAADGALARIRLPGGVIGAAALLAVAGCADELGDGRVHLTSRGNLQLRGLARTPALAARLAAAGLLPSATHERVRNVLASPLSGIATTDGVPFGASTVPWAAPDVPNGGSCDVRGLAAALDRELCARPVLAGLPGRFLFALDDGRGDVAAEDPDLCWRAPGFLLVAGVTVAEVDAADAVGVLLDAAEAFVALRAADGGTAWRAAELVDGPARIAGELVDGPARIVAALDRPGRVAAAADAGRVALPASDACGATLLASPGTAAADTASPAAAATPGPVRRDDGGLALVVAPLLGELTTAQVRLLACAAPTVVITPWRTVVLPESRLPAAVLAAAGLVVAPGPAADLSACAGRPGCARALADVRADARAALTYFAPGRVHVSGCARRCGAPRTPHSDAVALVGGGYLVDGVPRPELAR